MLKVGEDTGSRADLLHDSHIYKEDSVIKDS